MGRQENKRKKYYQSAGKKVARVQRTLEAGVKGFLLTCANNRERDCVREAYSIFNTYADKLHGPEKQGAENDSEEEDPDVALQQEVEAIKQASSSERRFQSVDTKCKNVIFVKTLLEHPDQLLETVFHDITEKRNYSSSQICRIMPVIGTCKANLKTIAEFAEQVLEPFFTAKSHSFSIRVKIRNNSSLTRNDILPMMGHVIKSMNPGNSVNLNEPEYIVSFDVLASVVCISVMSDFEKRCKYNLQELTCKLKLGDLKEDGCTEEKAASDTQTPSSKDSDATTDDSSSKNSEAKDCDNPEKSESQDKTDASNGADNVNVETSQSQDDTSPKVV